jgi:hypothetical protein
VRAEADQPQHRHGHERAGGGERHSHTLARAPRGEHQEGEREAGRDLDAHPGGQRRRGRTRARARTGRGTHPHCSRAQQQRGGERQQQQRVVVRSAHRQHQQHRVQPDERGRPAGGVAEAPGRPRDQRHRAEGRGDGDRLERPQPAGEPQRGDRVAEKREQRAVRGGLERPPDEPVHVVGGRFGGEVRVRVQSVQDPQPRERQIAEHVLGDQRRPEQQDRVRQHDRARERRQRQPRCDQQHQQVARAHEQHQRLEASAGEAHAETSQRARQPGRPAAFAGRDVAPWSRRGARAHQEDRRHDAEQPECAECSHDAHGCP